MIDALDLDDPFDLADRKLRGTETCHSCDHDQTFLCPDVVTWKRSIAISSGVNHHATHAAADRMRVRELGIRGPGDLPPFFHRVNAGKHHGQDLVPVIVQVPHQKMNKLSVERLVAQMPVVRLSQFLRDLDNTRADEIQVRFFKTGQHMPRMPFDHAVGFNKDEDLLFHLRTTSRMRSRSSSE